MTVRGAVLVAVAALLTACSASDGPSDAPAAAPSTQRPTAVVTPTADPQTSRLQALAQLAEQRAAALPSAPPTGAALAANGPVLGADISWPQCPKGMGIPERRTLGLPMPLPEAQYVVVGLTNGPGFTANPCLASQVAWIRERHLLASAYAVVSRPDAAAVAEHGGTGPFDGATDVGALANTGYQQALANVATMRAAGLDSPIIWVDVEPVPDFDWGDDIEANGAVVQGAARGYADAGYDVGVYSTPHLWSEVVGDLALGLPEWRAAGETSQAEALDRCGDDWQIQGGDAVLGQWVAESRDLDVTCPGVTDLSRWFRQY
ncbi:hypothetical protein ASC77_22270 [Nocardioides sp. Root1257]|uniref:hypothetical protein n=1 Tax=unclassified Nocardioides TaxID=2615069 RepID=UPI0006F528D3|nr:MULTISPECIES: hypothetical protein [unclassified Nocardioides]KQW43023.1 hypothetical protein ASC77_22270 [Nocardioides sp. Root1257]KRC41891.1 hypothetical protein ASE24_22060 [Nocardioides sp. Root224]